MRERCRAGLQYGVGDAKRKVQPIPARIKKLANTCIICRLKVSAFCQIFYEHFSTTSFAHRTLLASTCHYYYKEIFIRALSTCIRYCPGNLQTLKP